MHITQFLIVFSVLFSSLFQSRILNTGIQNDEVYQGICTSYVNIVKGYKCIRNFYIGRGESSSVFLVKNEADKVFAMKVQQKTEQSLLEAKIYDELKGEPYIAQKQTEGMFEDIHVIILEYGMRKSLEVVLQTSDYFNDLFKTLDFFKKLLIGIISIQKHNYVHRNINLQNIVVTENYEPLIIDFGSAIKIDSQDYFLGVPIFMSPELILAMNSKEKINYTTSIDVFAAGIILYYMKMHKYPFDNYQMQYNQMIKTPVIFKEDSSSLFMNIILRCLQLEERRETAEQLLDYLNTNADEQHEYPLVNSYYYQMRNKDLKIYISDDDSYKSGTMILFLGGILIFSFSIIFLICQLCFFFVWSKTSGQNMSARPSEMNIDTTFIDSVNVSKVIGIQKD